MHCMDPRLSEEKAELSALCSLPGMTPSRTVELVTVHGSPAAAWEAVCRGMPAGRVGGERAAEWRRWARGVDPAARLRSFEGLGINVVAAGEHGYPPLLAETRHPPPVLYYRGGLPDPAARMVALVGSRKATPYGLEVSSWFARELAGYGVLVVSGAAYGIDSASHRGALEAGGLTLAVLGCGPDIAYPRSNARLLEEIARKGCVLSEYPPGTHPLKAHFPARNRIIAGISLGVVVVEAACGSGALITAEFALSEGREVFSVPGSILSASCAGTNGLIRNGAAPVSSPDDIVADLGLEPPRLFRAAREPSAQAPVASPVPGGSKPERGVLEALASGPADIEGVSLRAGATVATAMSVLARLEVEGKVRRGVGGVYHLAARSCSRSRPKRR